MNKLSPQEEIILLRKKARRRLVGTIALVAIATAVLWKTLEYPHQIEKHLPVSVIQDQQENSVSREPPRLVESSAPSASAKTATITPAIQESPSPKEASTASTEIKQKAKIDEIAARKLKAAQRKARLAKAREKATAKLAKEQLNAMEKLKLQEQLKAQQPAHEEHKKTEPDPEAILNGRADAR